MWFSSDTLQILSRELPEQSGREESRSEVIRRDAESREQRIGKWDRFIVVEENKASLADFLSTEMSQRYRTHPVLDVSGWVAAGSEKY